jgi:hypothetical protein
MNQPFPAMEHLQGDAVFGHMFHVGSIARIKRNFNVVWQILLPSKRGNRPGSGNRGLEPVPPVLDSLAKRDNVNIIFD